MTMGSPYSSGCSSSAPPVSCTVRSQHPQHTSPSPLPASRLPSPGHVPIRTKGLEGLRSTDWLWGQVAFLFETGPGVRVLLRVSSWCASLQGLIYLTCGRRRTNVWTGASLVVVLAALLRCRILRFRLFLLDGDWDILPRDSAFDTPGLSSIRRAPLKASADN